MKPLIALTAILLLLAASVSAQEAEKISVAAGGGLANPLHGDFQFTAGSWEVAFRGHPEKHVSFEVFYGEWRHTEKDVRTDISIRGNTGVEIGRIGRLEQEARRVTRTGGINVLARFPVGRSTIWGGGGPAFMDFSRAYSQVASNCTGAAPCTGYSNSGGSGVFALQLTAGVDVPIAGRIGAYGRFTTAVPVDDPGAGHLAYTGGVRVRIW